MRTPPRPVLRRAAVAIACLLSAAVVTDADAADAPRKAAPPDPVRAAERAILDACIREEGTSAVRCGCYVATLKETLPPAGYGTMVRLAAAGMTGDMRAFEELIAESGLTPARLQAMIEDTDRALKKAEKLCEAR